MNHVFCRSSFFSSAIQELSAFEQKLEGERTARVAKLQEQRQSTHALGQANQALLARHFTSTAATGAALGAATPNGPASDNNTAAPVEVSQCAIGAEATQRQIQTPEQAVAALCTALSCATATELLDRVLPELQTLNNLQEMQQAAVHQVGGVNCCALHHNTNHNH